MGQVYVSRGGRRRYERASGARTSPFGCRLGAVNVRDCACPRAVRAVEAAAAAARRRAGRTGVGAHVRAVSGVVRAVGLRRRRGATVAGGRRRGAAAGDGAAVAAGVGVVDPSWAWDTAPLASSAPTISATPAAPLKTQVLALVIGVSPFLRFFPMKSA